MDKSARNTLIFFGATFAWTWACYAPMALTGHSPYAMPWTILLIAGGMGPSLMGILLAMLTCDRAGRRDYWRRCFDVRLIGARWWAVIALLFPVVLVSAVALDVGLGGARPGLAQFTALLAQPALWPLAALISFMSGPWSEEFGWRGYALDPLLNRFGALRGSLILGAAWGVWHLPLYYMPATWHGQMGFGPAGFWSFMLLNIGLALVMTGVYRRTNRSILTGMLLHFASNFTAQLAAPVSDRVEVMRALLILAVGVVVCALAERRARPVRAGPPALPA